MSRRGVQIPAAAPVEGVGGVQQRVVEGAQRGRRTGGRGQRPGVRVLAYGGGEPSGPRGGPSGHGLLGPGERGRGLGEGQRGGVLGVQPPLGGRAGVPPQPGPGERVLGVVEGGGERDAAGDGVLGPRGVEQVGDGVVHRGDGVPFAVEPEVPGDGAGRGQRRAAARAASRPRRGRRGPAATRPPATASRPRSPRRRAAAYRPPDATGPTALIPPASSPTTVRTTVSGDGPDVLPGVRPDDQPDRPRERGHPEPLHGDPPAPGPVVDPGEHGGDGGDDTEGGPVRRGRRRAAAARRPAPPASPRSRAPARAGHAGRGRARAEGASAGASGRGGTRGSCRRGEGGGVPSGDGGRAWAVVSTVDRVLEGPGRLCYRV